jgi:hypothetical protein
MNQRVFQICFFISKIKDSLNLPNGVFIKSICQNILLQKGYFKALKYSKEAVVI